MTKVEKQEKSTTAVQESMKLVSVYLPGANLIFFIWSELPLFCS